jgi:hypothetical protein
VGALGMESVLVFLEPCLALCIYNAVNDHVSPQITMLLAPFLVKNPL